MVKKANSLKLTPEKRLKILKEAYEIYKERKKDVLSKYKMELRTKDSYNNVSICEAIIRSEELAKEMENQLSFVDLEYIHEYFPELMKLKPHRKLGPLDYWWVIDCTKDTRDKVFEKMIKELEEKI